MSTDCPSTHSGTLASLNLMEVEKYRGHLQATQGFGYSHSFISHWDRVCLRFTTFIRRILDSSHFRYTIQYIQYLLNMIKDGFLNYHKNQFSMFLESTPEFCCQTYWPAEFGFSPHTLNKEILYIVEKTIIYHIQ